MKYNFMSGNYVSSKRTVQPIQSKITVILNRKHYVK